jgi:hypothetical protein
MKKSSVENPTRDSMPIMLMLHLTRTICLFKLSTTWISAGKQILASSKRVIQITDPTVIPKLLIWPKHKPKLILRAKLNYSKNIQTSMMHGQRPKNTKRSTPMPTPSQILSFLLTSTGEMSRESTSQASIETKVTAVLVTPFHSPKSLR